MLTAGVSLLIAGGTGRSSPGSGIVVGGWSNGIVSAGLDVTVGVAGELWANGAGAVVTGGGGRVTTGGVAGGLLPLTGTGTV
ncbi:MAG: hypothetical protein Q7K33_03255 [Candidatus Berkelbacteria bacterium]|nr:hypothetical protein [Candidatus Berkelbacteria bacterium]